MTSSQYIHQFYNSHTHPFKTNNAESYAIIIQAAQNKHNELSTFNATNWSTNQPSIRSSRLHHHTTGLVSKLPNHRHNHSSRHHTDRHNYNRSHSHPTLRRHHQMMLTLHYPNRHHSPNRRQCSHPSPNFLRRLSLDSRSYQRHRS